MFAGIKYLAPLDIDLSNQIYSDLQDLYSLRYQIPLNETPIWLE